MIVLATTLLSGCHTLRLGSPQITRAPEIRCVVVVQTDHISEEVAQMAINVCRDAIAGKAPEEPKK